MTQRRTWIQRLVNVVMAVGASTLIVAMAVPHHHDRSAFSHQSQSCRICRAQEAFAATVPMASAMGPTVIEVVEVVRRPVERVIARPVLRSHSPRSPPLFS